MIVDSSGKGSTVFERNFRGNGQAVDEKELGLRRLIEEFDHDFVVQVARRVLVEELAEFVVAGMTSIAEVLAISLVHLEEVWPADHDFESVVLFEVRHDLDLEFGPTGEHVFDCYPAEAAAFHIAINLAETVEDLANLVLVHMDLLVDA